jgi:hypothetical protein
MKSPVSKLSLGSEFDNFLFEPVGEDPNGLAISVVSMLGRLNLDPWEAAASLTRLPVESATQKLMVLLSQLPGTPLPEPHARVLASRLVALLPRQPGNAARSPQASAASAGSINGWLITNRVYLAVYLGLILTTQLVIAQLEPTRPDAAHTLGSDTAHWSTPPPASVK